MNDQKIEAINATWVNDKMTRNPSNITLRMNKKQRVVSDSSLPRIYKAVKHFDSCTKPFSQDSENGYSVVALFSSSESITAHSDCCSAADLEAPCICACQFYLPKLRLVLRSAAPRALPLILQSKPLRLWLSSGTAFWNDCQKTVMGLSLNSNLNFAAWPISCKYIISSKITV